ncbi:methyltransferase domain-containing protein [Lentibacter algarum]|uniref:class I SAM-dependent DNA methyltransferase n=1 Tax=Lentibacter algarum TaxID=576131 RepID=UPI001C0A55E0|nr:methyltransferase domain-containing protein [Lentibacter algarum]MBU2982467.1 methyltransferase domain-containing protein [Lentibacter algarum]
MTDKFLEQAYDTPGDTRDLYNAWAKSYDAELSENGYVTPERCAAALRAYSAGLDLPVLDFGCGTGLSGLALKLQGFELIDGVDVSSDMLEGAREKQIYRKLTLLEPGSDLPHKAGAYAAITCIGVIGVGAAPISVFDQVMNGLAKGGLTVLSFNDHALEDPAYEAKLDSYTGSGQARLLFKEHGPHIPGIGLGSNVYVLEKL